VAPLPLAPPVAKSGGSEPGEQEPTIVAKITKDAANPNPATLVFRSATGREVMLRLPEVCMGPPRVGDDTTIIQFWDGRLRIRKGFSARSGN
jgi:hypothetical protein